MKLEHPGPQHIDRLRELWQEAFGDTEAFLDCFFATAFSPQRCLCVTDGSRVLSAGYWLDVDLEQGKGAYLYAVATAGDSRGKGLAHRLLEEIHRQLRQQGYHAALLVPGEESLGDFYGAMGYSYFGGTKLLSVQAEKPAIAMRRLQGAEYARLRRNYLPYGAVVQEQENIAFLESYAQLYAGEDFLLAAWGEDDILSGLELLGNETRAPYIVEALGFSRGNFRMPGRERFAMWLPFGQVEEPTYFGLAFD